MAQRNTKTARNITDILLYMYSRSRNSFFYNEYVYCIIKKENLLSTKGLSSDISDLFAAFVSHRLENLKNIYLSGTGD